MNIHWLTCIYRIPRSILTRHSHVMDMPYKPGILADPIRPVPFGFLISRI